MDPKTWLWKKKSSEKTIAATASDKVNGEETPGARKVAELERCMETLNEKLSSALSECKAKDELATKQAKAAEETLEGWEKTKAEATSLKQNLDKALQQRVIAEERISHLDAALKECMQQLRFVREEQEQRIHDAVKKTTREQEKIQRVLEDKLAETNERLSDLGMENTHLSNTIQIKEEMIEDLRERNSQAEADYNALRARLDSMQKDNASMNYELRMLEKELEIRNEEREFNRRSTDASHKQHLESVKKIANLEAECQKLRLLVQKRLPGPAALARMKNEVDMLGKDQAGPTRTKPISPNGGSGGKEFSAGNSPNKKANYLIERLCSIEEENKTLKEAMSKKTSELESSRNMCSHTSSKLSQVEAQLAELLKGQTTPRNIPTSRRLSFASEAEINASEDTESWASPLISENGHFKKTRGSPSCKTVGSLDISLMDDFVEMEKFAIVCTDKSPGDSHVSSEAIGKELVPVTDSFSDTNQESRPKATSIEDIKTALADMSRSNTTESVGEGDKTSLSSPSKFHPVSGTNVYSNEKSTRQLQSGLEESISKIVELIERINHQSSKEQMLSEDNGSSLPYRNSLTSTGYTYRVFQWKSTELNHVLRQFVHTCNDLLNGEAEFENFAGQLTSTFEWIMNHCFSLQDVSSMKDTIKKHFDWDESRSESEHGTGMKSLSSETEKPQATDELRVASQAEEILSNLNEENKRLKDELTKVVAGKEDLEERLQSATDKIEALMSEKGTADLQTELEALRASKETLEGEIENHKLLNEELNTQLTVVREELNEVQQKFSSLGVELEEKKNSCRELETTCLDQQLRLESVTKNGVKHDTEQNDRQVQNGWEITAASEKLAECQETILNLGKQLKALSLPREIALLDKVISVTPSTNMANNNNNSSSSKKHASSLLDQILSENGTEREELESPEMKEIICTMDSTIPPTHLPDNPSAAHAPNGQAKPFKQFTWSTETKYKHDTTAAGALAIIPSKKRGGGGGISFFRKLLSRRKRESSSRSKRIPLPKNA